MNLTLQEVRAAVMGLNSHPLTPTDITGLHMSPNGLAVEKDDSDLRDELEDARKDLAAVEADLKQAEAERDEWERKALEQETTIENAEDAFLFQTTVQTAARFRETSIRQAEELAVLRAEVSALRKRKGIAAGVAAYSHEVWTLLGYISQTDGRYRDDARKLCQKISAL